MNETEHGNTVVDFGTTEKVQKMEQQEHSGLIADQKVVLLTKLLTTHELSFTLRGFPSCINVTSACSFAWLALHCCHQVLLQKIFQTQWSSSNTDCAWSFQLHFDKAGKLYHASYVSASEIFWRPSIWNYQQKPIRDATRCFPQKPSHCMFSVRTPKPVRKPILT